MKMNLKLRRAIRRGVAEGQAIIAPDETMFDGVEPVRPPPRPPRPPRPDIIRRVAELETWIEAPSWKKN